MGKTKPKNWVLGRWLIDSMDQWDSDFIDEEVRGYFEFDAKDSGDFQFGYVQGQIDYRLGEPMIDETYGVLCEARMEGQIVTVPLGELENAKPNRRLIDDYCYWFHNWA